MNNKSYKEIYMLQCDMRDYILEYADEIDQIIKLIDSDDTESQIIKYELNVVKNSMSEYPKSINSDINSFPHYHYIEYIKNICDKANGDIYNKLEELVVNIENDLDYFIEELAL